MSAAPSASDILAKAKSTLAKANSDFPSSMASSAGAKPANEYSHTPYSLVKKAAKPSTPAPATGLKKEAQDVGEGIKARQEMESKALGPGED